MGVMSAGRGLPPRPPAPVSVLPDEFSADLPDARIAGLGDIPEVTATDIPARVHELRMVEDVKELTSNLENLRFCDWDSLGDSEIGVVESRTVEEPAIGGSETSAIWADQNTGV